MAFEGQQILDGTRVCGSVSLATKQFYYVKLHTDGTLLIVDAVADIVYGILQNKPGIGESAIVCLFGISKVSANEDLGNSGTVVGHSADGQAEIKVPGTDTQEFYTGQLIAGGSAAGNLATVLHHPPVWFEKDTDT